MARCSRVCGITDSSARDDKEREVDAPDAREHVLDEPLVSRDVDDAHLASAGQREPREAQVDGHAALLLLIEAVGVDPRKGEHERRLAMVDVSGGPDDVHGREHSKAPKRACGQRESPGD